MNNNTRKVLSREVYEKIKEMIFSKELAQGDRIPEEKMAEFVGGSRTPVREALRLLSAEGLVEVAPRHCASVRVYDQQAMEEVGTVRLSQDILAARLAIQFGTNQDFLDMRPLVEVCEECAKRGDIQGFITSDHSFHTRIVEVRRNRILIDNQKRLYQIIRLIQISHYSNVEKSLQDVRHHREILDGLLARDYVRTSNAICDHLKDYYHINAAIANTFRALPHSVNH